jgi:sugar phosphate isomerase/epimerase
MNRRDFLATTTLPLSLPLLAQAQGTAGKKARLKPALCAYSFREQLSKKTMTYEDLVGKCVDWDVDGLDTTVYWFPNTTPEWLTNLRRVAYRQGIELYSIAVRTELTKASQEDRDKEVAALGQWVEVASLLGAGHIRVFGGAVPKGMEEAAAVPWVVECLKRAADVAGEKGIILGLENHGGICTRAERILEMVTKVNSPWVGINLDTGNFEKDAFSQMKMCLPYAVNVQVKAEMKFDDGTVGPQDWDKVVRLIAEGGYRGYLSLEYEAKEPAATAVPRGLKQLGELTRKYSAR